MFTTKVHQFCYDNGIVYTFFNLEGDQIDLQNGDIDFAPYVNRVCDIYGDFLPPKTTRTGKVKNKFLVLRIEYSESEVAYG